MKKRIIAALLAMTMVLSMVACGQTDSASSDETTETEETEDGGSTSDEEITLTLAMIGDGTTKDTLDELLEMYYEETGIKVESIFVATDWGTYCTTLQTMIGGGESVDCAVISSEGIAKFLDLGVAEPIDDWIAENPDTAETILSETNDTFEEFFTADGNTYAFPFSFNCVIMHFNTDRLAEVGLEVPEAGWDIDEFLYYCEKLTYEEDGVKYYAVTLPYGNYFTLEAWLVNNGTGVLNEDWTESTIATEESIEVFQLMQDLVYEYGYAPIPEENVSSVEQLMSGQCAMGTWGKGITTSYAASDFTSVGIQYLPSFSTNAQVFGIDGIFTLSCSENMEAAKDLAAWLSMEDFGREYLASGNVPANVSLAEELLESVSYVENYELFYQDNEATDYVAMSTPGCYTDISSIVLTALSDILVNQADVETTLIAADEAINEILASY